MVLLDKYLKVIPKNNQLMTSFFKVAHLSIIVCSVVSAFISSYYFATAMKSFEFQCILSAKIKFRNISRPNDNFTIRSFPRHLMKIDSYRTVWGPGELCQYVHFSILSSGIFAFIWGAFFVISGKGGEGKRNDEMALPWRIVFPALLFTIIFTIFIFESDVLLRDGITTFCEQFEPIFGISQCTHRIDIYTLTYSSTRVRLINYLYRAKYASYTCFWTWVAQIIVLTYRLMAGQDFLILVISIFSESHNDDPEPETVKLKTTQEEIQEEHIV